MPDEPIAERPRMPEGFDASQHGTLPWSWALERLQTARNFWLATVYPDGRPHLMPIWCVWLNSALYFSTAPSSRKARNFTANANVAVSTDGAVASVEIEGTVAIEEDRSVRQRVADAYSVKYGWAMQVTETGIRFDDAIASPLYVIRPRVALGVTDDEVSRMTRWRFA